ncbi:type III pantothenate kinase [Spiroplasma tabanidicola]|uniref:Type III pantothenate kinase n=1 Tax=Spiroplasma tabanidicola TaxID=324079 RepID=A0A6I6C7X6_9MOLU|nr:type III pantothenate kinase [Spiroplasma tabanidicola]QGS52330.1 type III pantothenate kinase [Spiroplasma tabanidicola]
MNVLLVDVGNSTVDFRVWNKKTNIMTKIFRPETHEKEFKSSSRLKRKILSKNIGFDEIIYCSVVPEWNDIIRALGQSVGVKVYNFRNELVINNSDFNLEGVENIGADILANFSAVKLKHKLDNVAVISMGTATTIFVVQNKKFQGVSISPGLETSIDGLISKASLLKNFVYAKTNVDIGKTTNDAINLGACNGHFFMIKGLIEYFKTKFTIDKVIITGGIANIFEDDIFELNYTLNEQLIFEGIIEVYKQIKKEG